VGAHRRSAALRDRMVSRDGSDVRQRVSCGRVYAIGGFMTRKIRVNDELAVEIGSDGTVAWPADLDRYEVIFRTVVAWDVANDLDDRQRYAELTELVEALRQTPD